MAGQTPAQSYPIKERQAELMKERTLLLWINAIIYNNKLIDQTTYGQMDRKIRASFDKKGRP